MAFDHRERNQQIEEGRQRSSTLHVRSAYNRRGTDHSKPRPERGERGTRGGAPKGHDATLKDLQNRQATVEIHLMASTDVLQGTIVASDKFVISLRDADNKVHHIYKHGIESFSEIAAAA